MRRWEVMHAFLSRNYRADLPLLSRRVYQWQFLVDDYGGNACMLCAWDGNHLVGILGYMPTLVFWGDVDRPVLATWTANWVVEKPYRHGLGWSLLRKLQEMYPVVLGVGASSENERMVKRL